MATPESIEQRYRNDLEAAEAWKDANPERYAEEVNKAATRRADAYAEWGQERDKAGRDAELSQARTSALAKFPLADPDSVTGDTTEAISASAERSHNFVNKQREDASKAALEARRPATRQAWTGSPTAARPGLPGGELTQPEPRNQDLVNRTYARTEEIINESRKPGTLRRYSDETLSVLRAQDTEAQAVADYRILHPNTHLSDTAMKARSEGAVLVPGQSGVSEAEDNKG